MSLIGIKLLVYVLFRRKFFLAIEKYIECIAIISNMRKVLNDSVQLSKEKKAQQGTQ